jgi:hypothetical protein
MPRTLAGLVLTTFVALALAAPAGASRQQLQLMQADPLMLADPVGTLAQFRALGANAVRIIVHWDFVAPDPDAADPPTGFDGSDPTSYPAANWAAYDAIVRDARQAGITVDFTVAGGAPRWAEGAHVPPQGLIDRNFAWKPSATLYGQFVHAIGERYDGSFTPEGAASPLPAVHFWALWNEPNFGQDLGPQAIKGSTVSVGPMMYRALVDTGWRSLQQTGHGSDTIVIGGFAAEGRAGPVNAKHPQGLPGDYAQTKPLLYIPTLYCLSAGDKPLRGRYARDRGCPTTAAGTRSFRAAHPGLFNASGVADHPYSGGRSPVNAQGLDKNFAIFSQLGNLERTLDRAQAAYGSHKRLRIYSDEYGYITHPPQVAPYASPATASYYMNWAEYLSWRSSRIGSYAQYLLRDPPRGFPIGFTSGLESDLGKPKATYYAYRMPVYLPATAVRRGRPAEIWGSARPARFMARDGHGPQSLEIQFQAAAAGAYRTVRTVAANGYFDVRVPFTRSGNLRLAYTYPSTDPFLPVGLSGTTAYSRTVKVTVG